MGKCGQRDHEKWIHNIDAIPFYFPFTILLFYFVFLLFLLRVVEHSTIESKHHRHMQNIHAK